MAKRGASKQRTKDDGESSGEEDEGIREVPLAPQEGRQIRGLPKRKGMVAPAPSSSGAPSSGSGFSAAPAATSTPFGSNTFGTRPPTSQFTFGQPASGSTGAAPTFSFGAPSNTPAAPAPSAPATSSPFAGFSFAKPAAAPAPTGASQTPAEKPAEAAASAAPKPFAGFSFGAPSAPAPAVAAPAPAAPAAPAAPSKPFAGFSFGAASTPKPPAPAPATSAPAPVPSFSATTSANAAEPSSKVTSSSSNGTQSAKTATPSLPTPPPQGEVKYYTAIRGLNTSILSFITTTLEKNAFTNLSDVLPGLLQQYEQHLDSAVKKAGWSPEKPAESKPSSAPAGFGFSPAPAAKPAAPSMPSAPSMPAPPTVGSFTLPKASASTSTPSGGGFVPTLPQGSSSSASPFQFGSFGQSASKPTTAPAAKPQSESTKLVQDVIDGKDKTEEEKEQPKSDKPAPSGFSFGPSSTGTSTSATPAKKPTSTLFSFAPSGPLHPSTPGAPSFSPSANIESPSTSSPANKLGKFGPGGSTPQLSFGGASSTSPASSAPKAAGFSFGAPSSGSTGFHIGSGDGKPATAAPSFSFGAPSASSGGEKAKAPTSTFPFGSTTPSTAPKASSASTAGFSFGSSSPSFGFGSSSTAPASGSGSGLFGGSSSTAPPAASGEEESTEDSGSAEAGEPSQNLAEATGQGEEGEETVVEQRAKLYKLTGGSFVVQGLGVIRLKRKTEGDGTKRRLLMRGEGGGNILLNMAIKSDFAPTAEGTQVKFLGFDLTGNPSPYSLRVKTAEMAQAFVDAVKKEVQS